jgi:hypothetical protein
MAIMVPFGGPLKPPDLQVKIPFGSGIRVLWGEQRTRLAFFSRLPVTKYCHNGGIALAHPSRRRLA